MADNGDGKKKASIPAVGWIKLAAFGFIAFIFLGGLAIWMTFGELVTCLMFPPQWKRDFDVSLAQFRNDDPEAGKRAKKAIEDAKAAGAKPAVLMGMERELGNAFFYNDDAVHGEEEMAAGIALCPPESYKVKGSPDVFEVSQTYQDRAWERHKLHLEDPSKPSGVPDQERSLELAEKNYGAEHVEPAYKLAFLAVLYSENGDFKKAEETMQRTLKLCKRPDIGFETGWYAYAMNARMLAGQGKRKEAFDAYLKGMPLAKTDHQRKRLGSELARGFKYSNSKVPSPFASVLADLKGGNYDALDALDKKLTESKQEKPSGHWLLDEFYETFSENDKAKDGEMDDEQYKQRIADLKSWMSKKPQSTAARLALSETYIKYAWFARGSGYADTVTEDGWARYRERIETAKKVLDEDPKIKEKSPRAFDEYGTVALAQGMDKDKYLQLVDECHRLYPTYLDIDLNTCYFLLPRWHGEEQDTEKYIIKRADAIGGGAGDKAYAQMVWFIANKLEAPFAEASLLKWDRTKAGFKQLFKAYPQDSSVPSGFIELSREAGDEASLKDMI